MQPTIIRPRLAQAVFFALVFAAAPAFAEVVAYKADLKASTEVPPNDSKGAGSVDATYDAASKKLSWTISYSGLTGPAVAAHFHGPATPAEIALPVVPVTGDLASPIKGEATLTDAQAAELTKGLWYFNIHTAANRVGEIRGQMTPK